MNGDVLAGQLGQLGLDLDQFVTAAGVMDEASVDAEATYRRLQGEHEDDLARSYKKAQGGVEARKVDARLECIESRLTAELAYTEWQRKKARLRTQQASISALHRRIEIGRSLLSREKALMVLE